MSVYTISSGSHHQSSCDIPAPPAMRAVDRGCPAPAPHTAREIVGLEKPAPLAEPLEEGELSGVVLRIRLCGELLAQQRALPHELLPRRAKAREIDVFDEASVVATRAPLMARGQDEAAHAPAEGRFRPVRQREEQFGAAPLVVAVVGSLRRRGTTRNFHGVPIRKRASRLRRAGAAIADVMQIVEAPIRRARTAAQFGMDVAGGSGMRGRDTTAPQRVNRAVSTSRAFIGWGSARVDDRCWTVGVGGKDL